MKSTSLRHWLVVALWFPLLAHADFRYWIEPIDVGDPTAALVVNDLNNRGEVVGEVFGNRTKGFYWRNGQYKDLDPLLGPSRYFSSAASINDRSQIVGAAMDDQFNLHGKLVDGNRTKSLPEAFTEPTHINIRGQVVTRGEAGSFVLHRGQVVPLQALSSSRPVTAPLGFNNWGVVVGESVAQDGFARPVAWLPPYRDVMPLPLPTGYVSGQARAINDRGQIVGALQSDLPRLRAFSWKNGRSSLLRKLYADQRHSEATDINDFGVVVGYTVNNDGAQIATLWLGNAAYDLNRLVSPRDPRGAAMTLMVAYKINELGQILAIGRETIGTDTRDRWVLLSLWRR